MEFSTPTVYSVKDSHFASKLYKFQKLETMKKRKGCWMMYSIYYTSILETGIGEYLFRAILEVHSEALEGGREKEEGLQWGTKERKDSLNIWWGGFVKPEPSTVSICQMQSFFRGLEVLQCWCYWLFDLKQCGGGGWRLRCSTDSKGMCTDDRKSRICLYNENCKYCCNIYLGRNTGAHTYMDLSLPFCYVGFRDRIQMFRLGCKCL